MQQLLDGRGTRKQEKKGVKSSILSVPFCACEERGEKRESDISIWEAGEEKGTPHSFRSLAPGKTTQFGRRGTPFFLFLGGGGGGEGGKRRKRWRRRNKIERRETETTTTTGLYDLIKKMLI